MQKTAHSLLPNPSLCAHTTDCCPHGHATGTLSKGRVLIGVRDQTRQQLLTAEKETEQERRQQVQRRPTLSAACFMRSSRLGPSSGIRSAGPQST